LQNGSNQSSFIVSQPGIYRVKVDENGCDTTGTIAVSYITKPTIEFNDTTICITQQLLLDASFPQSSYLWQDGSTLPKFTITQAGNYAVDVTNTCGSSKAVINVSFENCACKFYVPNAFTPNHDGVNDLFLPKYQCLFSNYALKIFNRWGQVIFASKNSATGWDGSFSNEEQPMGTYVWELSYKDDLTGKSMIKHGTVVLIR